MKTMKFVALGLIVFFMANNVVKADEIEISWPLKNGETVELIGLTAEAIEGLSLVQGGVKIRGFASGDSDAIMSVTTLRAANSPVDENELSVERGRLKVWAYGLLLERFDGQEPIRIGGPLEPFLHRFASERGRTLCLKGFYHSGTFCVVTASLQDELHY